MNLRICVWLTVVGIVLGVRAVSYSSASSAPVILDTTFEESSSLIQAGIQMGGLGEEVATVSVGGEMLTQGVDRVEMNWNAPASGDYRFVWSALNCAMTSTVHAVMTEGVVIASVDTMEMSVDTSFNEGMSVTNRFAINYQAPGPGVCRVDVDGRLLLESAEPGLTWWTDIGRHSFVWSFDGYATTSTVDVVCLPVITAASTFKGSKTKVEISCSVEGARIYYTLDGTLPNSHSRPYLEAFYVTESTTVRAFARLPDRTDTETITWVITKERVIGDALGAPDHAFTTSGDAGWVDVGNAMRSGAIGNCQTSILETVVMGPGRLSFAWKTSCEEDPYFHEWDHAECWLDGERVGFLEGIVDWEPVVLTVVGDGTHTVRWFYMKDDMSADGEDCAWVKDFVWQGESSSTQTTDVPVPYTWLRRYFPDTPEDGAAYEAVAARTAANGLPVVACYVAGLDPTDALAALTALIDMKDGRPVVSWTPDLNEGGTKQVRVYRVFGKRSLEDAKGGEKNDGWYDVATQPGDYRFFKVSVELPLDGKSINGEN